MHKRILLKLSGEYLAGGSSELYDKKILSTLANEISQVISHGIEVGLVIGGGNIVRGSELEVAGLSRVVGDQMGMLATVLNALALRDALDKARVTVHLFSSVEIPGIAQRFNSRAASDILTQKKVGIFSGGTGNPFFTTDTAACLRAIEVDCDIVLKATKVDGVFSSDPVKDPNAKRYDKISYTQILEKRLGVMDLPAICLCRDHKMPLRVFDVGQTGAILQAALGSEVGTYVFEGE